MTLGEVSARDGVTARAVAFVGRRWWLVGGVVLLLSAVTSTVLLATRDYPRAVGPPRCSGTAIHTAALTTLVEPVPANADPQQVISEDGSTLTLGQTAFVARDRDARARELRQDGFVDATDQAWFYGRGGTMVNVRLLRFNSADGADAFFAANVARIAAAYGEARELPDVPGSFYFKGDMPDADPAVTSQGWEVGEIVGGPVDYALSYATVCVGDTVAVVYLWEPGPDQTLARRIVRNQYVRL